MEMIRRAIEDDVARIVEIARAAYIKYVPRMGREPPPMLADFAAEVAAVVSWCLRSRARSGGLFNLLAQNGNVFHRQHRCRPGAPGFGIGTTANGICCARSEASQLIRHPALHQRDNDRESCDVRPYGICRNLSCDGDAIPYRDRFPSGLYVSDASLKAKAHLARNDRLPAYFGDRVAPGNESTQMPLIRLNESAFDAQLEGVYFGMWNGSSTVRCFVTRAALTDKAQGSGQAENLDVFHEYRSEIEDLASAKCDAGKITSDGLVVVDSPDLNPDQFQRGLA
jgi:Protein of unknown function (DUF1488)